MLTSLAFNNLQNSTPLKFVYYVIFLLTLRINFTHETNSTIETIPTFDYREPKIAFLFLTQGHIPFEPIWKEFFNFRAHSSQFSIYVHPKKGFTFRNTSFFYKKEIKHTVETVYLKASVSEAERELLRAALKDPLNEFFCLISESCIPLHPFHTMRAALIKSWKSIVNACPMSPGISEVEARWREPLASVGLNKSHWRKSAQQFMLIRKHAELVANDEVVFKAFETVPIPDEHYIATLIGFKGFDNETTCASGFTYIHFTRTGLHPRHFGSKDISPTLFQSLEEEDIGCRGFSNECSGTDICHFTARKFIPEARSKLMDHIGYILSDKYAAEIQYPNSILAAVESVVEAGGSKLSAEDAKTKAAAAAAGLTLPTYGSAGSTTNPVFSKFSLPADGALVKARSERSIYLIQHGEKRELPNMNTFISMGFDLSNVTILADYVMKLIPLGPAIPDALPNKRRSLRSI